MSRVERALQEKIWGSTEALIITPMFEMHRLIIKPWHRCSMHVHQFKHNAFYGLQGHVFIDTEIGRSGQRVELLPDHVFTIAPGVAHQFQTASAFCTMLEMYFTEPLSEDIIRRNVGGHV